MIYGPPAIFSITAYGADPTGIHDSTAAIAAAKAAAGARDIILVPPGTYLTGPFTLDGFQWQGYGPATSIFKAAAGSADFVTNSQGATGQKATIVEGIGFDGSNLTGTATVFKWGETLNTPAGATIIMRDCWAYGGPATGIDTSAAGGAQDASHFENVMAYGNAGRGWIFGSDQELKGCVAANSGLEGFYTNSHSNFTLASCFSYGNGTVTGSSGHGYHLQGPSLGGSLVGCHAQDNNAAGVLFDSTTADGGYTVTGLVCDSNSRRGANLSPAVDFFSAAGNQVQFMATDRASVQLNALRTTSDSTGNVIECDAFYSSQTTVGNWFLSGNGAGNTVRLGNSGGTQAPAFAATITPDVTAGGIVIPAALTGNVTIAAPANPFSGAMLTFKFLQDGTGGRTVTWNAAFVFQAAWTNTGNTLNKRSVVSFVYDGSNWISLSPAANVWF